ncbi:MAG TPA: type I glyceraldehyde-3-phosphate dehydrogenase [Candidatus Babeliales bacterium]|nr:type I glyceraldehyde-3-phosphate dehydrogenase [Candidatus Babeliales bacterium]
MGYKIAINGFGRIGRTFFRIAHARPEIEIVAINDLGEVANLAYLLKYDSTYGIYERPVEALGDVLMVDGKSIKVFAEKDPAKLPWKSFGIDVVIESTGVFDSYDKSKAHLDAGAKRVVISAPAKDEGKTATATPGVNEEALAGGAISSNASCTTNAINPVVAVMVKTIGVKKGALNTVHGFTATQSLVDGPKKGDFRRGRAATENIVPSTTGAAEAVIKSIPEMKGKFDGISLRVPVISGSLIDFTFIAERPTTVDEVNRIFEEAAANPVWKGILGVTKDPIVSRDILKSTYGSLVDLALTRVIDGDLVKVFAWYDNEWGYSAMLVEHVARVCKLIS